ncbi:MAG: alpha/beta fold hydrolase [Acidimicrobiales bacterium]
MDRTSQVAQAPDGRTLVFAEWGDPDGVPIFVLHGTPGCRLNRHPNEELVSSLGARILTYDRPGYGGSDRQRGRAVADCAGDVAAIADLCDLERFAVTGGSGGGPHALAVAALLGERVTRAICAVGVAPLEALGDGWTDGMDPENVKEFGWTMTGEERLVTELEKEHDKLRQTVLSEPSAVLDQFDLPEPDREVLARPDFAEVLRESILEAARNGVWGWADDDLAFLKPWGFELTDIAVPTRIQYGSSDVMVPPSHGEWLAANVPGAEVKLTELGHMGDPDADLRDSVAWLSESS